MQPELLARLVGLVQKTGERVVLADPETGNAVVVMDLAEYERLCGASPHLPNPSSVTVTRGRSLGVTVTEEGGRSIASPPAPPTHHPKNVVEIPQKAPQPSIKSPSLAQGAEEGLGRSSYDNPFKKRGRQLGVEEPAPPAAPRDLTQEELLDKINRDIGAWKTAQEHKRTDELKAVVHNTPRLETVNAMEEEERFYLEPIE